MNKKTLVHACNFCDRPATKDVLGELEIFEQKIAKIYLCDQCFKSYKTGNKFGQLQIHQNIMSLIINAEDESLVYSLKEKLAEVAPLSKRFLFEKKLTIYKKVSPQDLYQNLNQKDFYVCQN